MEVLEMDKQFYEEIELSGSDKEKWEQHFMIIKLFEKGVELEEIAKIAGLSDEEMDDLFPELY